MIRLGQRFVAPSGHTITASNAGLKNENKTIDGTVHLGKWRKGSHAPYHVVRRLTRLAQREPGVSDTSVPVRVKLTDRLEKTGELSSGTENLVAIVHICSTMRGAEGASFKRILRISLYVNGNKHVFRYKQMNRKESEFTRVYER